MSKKLDSLKKFNIYAGMLHFVQGIVILLISSDFSRTVVAEYSKFSEETQSLFVAERTLFDLRFGYGVAAFFFMSAFAHLYVSVVANKWYNKNLKNGINKARWFEYAASASTMMVLIAMLTGIFDADSLLAIFGLTAVMNLLGLAMEVHNQTTKETNWLTYNIGAVAGIIPWLMVAIALWASGASAESGPPTFVYVIFFTIFLFFNTFAINMILQYKKVGKWEDYLYGERAYIILSLTAKTALAWQVYFGTLQP